MPASFTRRGFLRTAAGSLAAAAFAPVFAADAPKRAIRKAMMYATIGIKGTVLEKLTAIKAAGFEGVEPMSHMKQAEVVEALEKTGLKAASVCCSTHWRQTLSHPNEKVRDEGLDGVFQSLRDAKAYGADSVLLVPGVVNKDVTFKDCWTRSIAQIRKAIPLAEQLGVKIAIENVWNGFIEKPEQAKEYLDELKSEHVGWHLDVGNTIKFNAPETWVPVLGKSIIKLHIKEYGKAKGFGVKFFEGDNNWQAIMKALDAVGYAGWGISEQPGNQSSDAAALKDLSEKMDKIFVS